MGPSARGWRRLPLRTQRHRAAEHRLRRWGAVRVHRLGAVRPGSGALRRGQCGVQLRAVAARPLLPGSRVLGAPRSRCPASPVLRRVRPDGSDLAPGRDRGVPAGGPAGDRRWAGRASCRSPATWPGERTASCAGTSTGSARTGWSSSARSGRSRRSLPFSRSRRRTADPAR
jgi:hypothetical protein